MARPAFKHMGPNDVALFASFILSPRGQEFDGWEFDTHLGMGSEPINPSSMRFTEGMRRLTQLRVDAIGWRGLEPTVIEVKPEAKLSAFGQIQAYEFFWIRERGILPRKMIVTDWCSEDMQALYAAHDIEWQFVSPATPPNIVRARTIANARQRS